MTRSREARRQAAVKPSGSQAGSVAGQTKVRRLKGLILLGSFALGLVAIVVLTRAADRTPSELHTVRGVLLEVRATSIVYADSLTLRDDAGRVNFQVDPSVMTNREEPQTASHLRQHMALGEPMLVRYKETSTGLLALRVADAE